MISGALLHSVSWSTLSAICLVLMDGSRAQGLPAVSRSGPGGEYKQSAVGAEVGRSPRVAELLDRVKRKRGQFSCAVRSGDIM